MLHGVSLSQAEVKSTQAKLEDAEMTLVLATLPPPSAAHTCLLEPPHAHPHRTRTRTHRTHLRQGLAPAAP